MEYKMSIKEATCRSLQEPSLGDLLEPSLGALLELDFGATWRRILEHKKRAKMVGHEAQDS